MRNSKNGRLRVWDRAVDSFNSDDLVYNFDTIDWLFGGKSGTTGATGDTFSGNASTWLGRGDSFATNIYPGTKNSGFEDQTSGARTLYSVVSGLNYNDVPLGTVIQWWRPTASTDAGSGAGAIPDGWVPCDGRTLTAEQHSYGALSIVVPDLRNKFVLGADATVAGINAVTAYRHEDGAVSASNMNNDWTGSKKADGTTGAPGLGYDSGLENVSVNSKTGSNLLRDLNHNHASGSDTSSGLKIRDHVHESDHAHSLNSHSHTIPRHAHRMDHEHFIPNHIHYFNLTSDFDSGPNKSPGSDTVRVATVSSGGALVPRDNHVHNIHLSKDNGTGGRDFLPGFIQDSPGFPDIWTSEFWYFNGVPPESLNWRGWTPLSISSYPISASTANGLNISRQYNTSSVDLLTYPSGGGLTGRREKNGLFNPNTGTIAGSTTGTSSTDIAYAKGIDGNTADATWNSSSSSVNSQNKLNVRPQYVGLLYLIKVRVAKNLI
jgi:hypothetical protein